MIYDSSFIYIIFFFKQKTAYEMCISDWSSDVCSSDLGKLAQRQLSVDQTLDNQRIDDADGGCFGSRKHSRIDAAEDDHWHSQRPGRLLQRLPADSQALPPQASHIVADRLDHDVPDEQATQHQANDEARGKPLPKSGAGRRNKPREGTG